MKPQHILYLASACMFLMTVAYLLFLANCWNQYQNDRLAREEKINELLARFPRKTADATESKPPGADE